MRDLKDMAAKLKAVRTLPPGPDRCAIIEQIGTFRIELAAIAAKRKLLQSASFSWRPLFAQTAPVRGAKLGPSSGNGAVAARDVRL
jgi:hypothetical protein